MRNILPILLSMKNFTSYIDETIDFTKFNSPAIICGDNGNGKSSIIDAITTALYFRARGTDTRGTGIDDLITKGQKEFTINYIFEMDGHQFQIIRSKVRNGSHKLSLFIDGADQSSSIKETQQRIIDSIKIDFDTFIDTVCIAQNHASSFMEKSADKRKDIFIQILGLNEYDGLEKYVKDLRKGLVNELDIQKFKLEDMSKIISYKDDYTLKLQEYQSLLNNLDISKYEDELKILLAEQARIDTIKSKNELILSQRAQLQQSIKRYKNRIAQANKSLDSLIIEDITLLEQQLIQSQQSYDEISDSIKEKELEKNKYETKLSILKDNLNELKSKIKQFENYHEAICEFCGHEITDAYKEQYISSLRQQGDSIFITAKKYKCCINEINIGIDDFTSQLKTYKDEINKLNKQINISKMNEQRKMSLETAINDDNIELNKLEKDLAENNKQKVEALDTFSIITNVNNAKRKVDQLKNEENEYRSKIVILQDRLQKIFDTEDEYKILKDTTKDKEQTLDDYRSLITAFGKTGIQSYIIENTLPEIENEINDLLYELTNGKISISFIMQKETKTKTLIDTLDIMVNDSNVVRKYETFSGGEKFRIDFACHVGLSRFLAKRADASIDLFVLDENLGSQDETAKQIFVQCISKLTKYFKKILIITHINDIKDAFQNKILVHKDDKGSHVTIL